MEIIGATVIEEIDCDDLILLLTNIDVTSQYGTSKMVPESLMPRGHGYIMVHTEFPHLQASLTSTSGGRNIFEFS